MELTPHLDALRRDLGNAAALGDDAAREAANRLLLALDPALRMTFVSLLSEAAGQLSADLGDTVIDIRMAGRDPHFVVTRSHAEPTVVLPDSETDDPSTTRLTLRLPDGLKNRAEEAASKQGQSLNTWVVDAVRRALTPRPTHHGPTGRRLTGWV